MKVKGLRDIEKALTQLPAGTAKGVVRRAIKKELKPVADLANAFWPGGDDSAFVVTSKLKRSQPQPQKGRSIVNMFVGADRVAPHAHLIEFGTGPRSHKSGKYVGAVAPTPMLQPAWDARKGQMMERLGARIWEEIAKTMARRAKRAAG